MNRFNLVASGYCVIAIFAALIVMTIESAAFAKTVKPPQPPVSGNVISLDGEGWMLAIDPNNVGRDQQWWTGARPDSRPTKVPWVIEDIFPGYHGLVWYWKDFTPTVNSDPDGRYLVKFWNADYKVDVWLNGKYIGEHEGAEGVFVLDATSAIKPNESNRLAVRLLNPTEEPIEGIALKQTPHRNKTCNYTYGHDYNHGGLEDSVDVLIAPATRVANLYVHPDPKTGIINIQTTVKNALKKQVKGKLEIAVSPAANGETVAAKMLDVTLPVGDKVVNTQIKIKNPKLWQLNDPYMYRVTVRLCRQGSNVFDEQSARCGFRDFRIENGHFQLNGKRIFLRSSHTGNECPIGNRVSYDKEWLRRDLLNAKAMGFNAIRFISGLATPYQLDLCDEIGLMVYEEPYSAWFLEDSPKMAERYNRSTSDMILRDRNHPSVVMWGILNEAGDGAVFRHAVSALPLVRSLDNSRLVLLSSGRFDRQLGIGSVSNPGSKSWEFLLGDEKEGAGLTSQEWGYPTCPGMGDFHVYPQVPHTAESIRILRSIGQGTKPVFISEYGIATSVDLVRLARNFEQRGKENSGAGQFYGRSLVPFMADWEKWRLADTFGRPEDYFKDCLARNASQRLLGLNAIRSNPNINGYSLTGTVDQGLSGEGLTTTFRELKPGTIDAMFDGFAPLRWCTFAEPVNLYRGTSIKLEAVLANEDVLQPGEYPVRMEVFGPNSAKVFERKMTVTINNPNSKPQPPLALPVFSEDMTVNWPSGKYRFVATFERGGAAAGGEAEFYVADPADMPKVNAEVVLWGDDPDLSKWLTDHGIKVRPFAQAQTGREVILVGNSPAPGGAEAFGELARHIVRGSTAIFLSPGVFANGDQKTAFVPLKNKGSLAALASCVYHKDEWAKNHPIFSGLPTGLMDYTFYRETISSLCWTGLDAPAETVAGAIHASPNYESGLMISVNKLGAGNVVLNSLLIRENLGKSPVAERLLRNMLIYAAQDSAQPLVGAQPDLIAQIGLK